VTTGPQTERWFSAPETGFTSLKDEKNVLKTTRAAPPAPKAEAASPAPSNAARPKTDAPETNPAVKSPSDVKVSPAAEKAASVPSPKENAAAANKAEPLVEGVARKRSARTPSDAEVPSGEGLKAKAGSAAKQAQAADVGTPAAEAPSLDHANRPAGIERPAAPDDLQMISGVGPKIEGTLHSIGIFTFAQIAAWTADERAWVDGYLRFRGRIERENWVAQAKALAEGGRAEYVRVFGKEPR
jgi:NADH-quinone oxidoreductase subunit E